MKLQSCVRKLPIVLLGVCVLGTAGHAHGQTGADNNLTGALPVGAIAQIGYDRFIVTGPVEVVAYSTDGRWLAASGGRIDSAIHVFNAKTGELHRRIWLERSIRGAGLAISRDGTTVFSGGWSCDVETGTKSQLPYPVAPICFSSNQRIAVGIGADSANVRVWNSDGKEIALFRTGMAERRPAVALSSDGSSIAIGDTNHAQVWRTATSELLADFEMPAGSEVAGLAISSNGKLAASATGSTAIMLFDIRAKRMIATLNSPDAALARGPSRSFCFSSDGTLLASGGQSGSTIVWELKTAKPLRELGTGLSDTRSIAFAPDGKQLAIGNGHAFNSGLSVYGFESGADAGRPRAPNSPIIGLAFSPDGGHLYLFGQETHCWDVAQRHFQASAPALPWGAIGFTNDGWAVGSFSIQSNRLTVCEAATGNLLFERSFWPEIQRAHAAGHALASDLSLVALADHTGLLKLFDVSSGRLLLEERIAAAELRPTQIDVAGYFLAAPVIDSATASIVVWDTRTGEVWLRIPTPRVKTERFDPQPATGFEFSHDGSLLLVGRLGGGWTCISMGTRRLVQTFAALKGNAVFSRDCAFLLSSDGRELALNEIATGQVVWRRDITQDDSGRDLGRPRFERHLLQPAVIAMAPDGRTAATAQTSTTHAILWSLAPPDWREDEKADVDEAQLKAAWKDLAGRDGAAAYRAIWMLGRDPQTTLAFLDKQLIAAPQPVVDPAETARQIGLLDDDDPSIRNRAQKALEKSGAAVEPAMRKALEAQPSLEARERIRFLLELLDAPEVTFPSESVRWQRAVCVLDRIGGPAAYKLLERVAQGKASAPDTAAAAAARERVGLRLEKPQDHSK